jgi:hypothetical protein
MEFDSAPQLGNIFFSSSHFFKSKEIFYLKSNLIDFKEVLMYTCSLYHRSQK